MRLEHYSSAKLKKEILRIVGAQLNLKRYRIFFFGSRVTGKGTHRSDIDVGILGPESVPLNALGKIQEAMEDLPILYKIDVVDFKSASKDFKTVALEKIERIA